MPTAHLPRLDPTSAHLARPRYPLRLHAKFIDRQEVHPLLYGRLTPLYV